MKSAAHVLLAEMVGERPGEHFRCRPVCPCYYKCRGLEGPRCSAKPGVLSARSPLPWVCLPEFSWQSTLGLSCLRWVQVWPVLAVDFGVVHISLALQGEQGEGLWQLLPRFKGKPEKPVRAVLQGWSP